MKVSVLLLYQALENRIWDFKTVQVSPTSTSVERYKEVILKVMWDLSNVNSEDRVSEPIMFWVPQNLLVQGEKNC